jgi:hypothetical protein
MLITGRLDPAHDGSATRHRRQPRQARAARGRTLHRLKPDGGIFPIPECRKQQYHQQHCR